MAKSQKYTLLGTLVLATILTIGALNYFLNPPQCPEAFTQAQVDASHCIVGANMGLPIFLIAVACTLFLATHLALKISKKEKQ